MSTDSDFASAVSKKVDATGLRVSADEPFLYQDMDGDFVQFFVRRDAHRAEYVDDSLTVYYSRSKPSEIIGAKVSRVATLLESYPGIRLEVRDDGRVALHVLFMASRWTAATQIEDAAQMIYKKVRLLAEKVKSGVELQPA